MDPIGIASWSVTTIVLVALLTWRVIKRCSGKNKKIEDEKKGTEKEKGDLVEQLGSIIDKKIDSVAATVSTEVVSAVSSVSDKIELKIEERVKEKVSEVSGAVAV